MVQPKLQSLLNAFVEDVRPKLAGISLLGKSPVFASWSGKWMSSSLVSQALKSFVRNCLGKDNINTTVVRKMASTAVAFKAPDHRVRTAGHLLHLPSTQSKYYVLDQKIRSAPQASRVIHDAIRKDPANLR